MASPDHVLFYVSRARPGIAQGDINDLLEAAQQRNRRLGLTGMLLFSGEHFAQVLEGPREALDALLPGILADRRHQDVQLLCHEPLAQREFAAWSLAYVDTPGAADLLRALADTPGVPAPRARRLITLLFSPETESALAA